MLPPSPFVLVHVFTVPLKVNIIPKSSESVKVKVGEEYRISCEITGYNAPTSNPWRHSDKPVVNDTGVEVTIVSLHSPPRMNSTIVFAKVTKEQLGYYTCDAGEGKKAVITLAASDGK